MLKPHLLLTAIVLLLIAGFAVHMTRQQNVSVATGNQTSSADRTETADNRSDGGGNGYSSGDGYRDRGRNSYGNGGGFAPVPALTPEPLHAIFGSGAHDIWAVAGGGVTLHYTGAGWTKVLSGSTMALFGLHVDPRGEAVAVGQWGTILRY